jgi:hypothetical protein
MVRKALIFFLVTLKLLLLFALHATENFFGASVIGGIFALYHKEISRMQHILRVDGVTRTLAERQIIDGIQQIGLSHAVLPKEAVQLVGKSQVCLCYVLIIKYGDTVQYHILVISQGKSSQNFGVLSRLGKKRCLEISQIVQKAVILRVENY